MTMRIIALGGRRLAYTAVVQGMGRAAQLLSLTVAAAVLARHSAVALGAFGVAILVQSIVQSAGDWGLTPIGSQALVAGDPDISSGTLTWVRLHVQLPIVAAGGASWLALWASGRPNVALGVAAGVAAGVLSNVAASMTSSFQVDMRLDIPAWIDMATRAVWVGALWAIADHGSIGLILLTIPALAALDLIATAVAARARGLTLIRRTPWGAQRRLLATATPLAVLNLLGVLYLRASSLAVLVILGATKLGAYQLVFRILEVMALLPPLVLTAVFPVLVSLRGHDATRYRALCQRLHDDMLVVGAALSALTILAADPLIELAAGSHYLYLVTPLRILAVAGLAGFVNATFSQIMVVEGLQGVVLRLSAFALVGNLVVSLVLVPVAGLTGAAESAMVSEIAGAIVIGTAVCRHSGLRLQWRASLRTVAQAVAITLIGLLAEHLGVSPELSTSCALMLFAVEVTIRRWPTQRTSRPTAKEVQPRGVG
jgi:O-antigen/teichoic acid export membrane protein